MPFQNELNELEETIDTFSELRTRLERENPESLAVIELTRLELKLHEQARSLRRHRDSPTGLKKKTPKTARKAQGKADEFSSRPMGGSAATNPAASEG